MKYKLPIKKYVVPDKTLSWKELYERLEAQHIEETTLLIKEVERLEERIDDLVMEAMEESWYD
jgi:hypothetical protein